MKVVVDPKLCLGCGTCVALAPKSFQLGKDGKAEVLEPPGDDEKTIKEAIGSCPVGAIKTIN
jgi:ferredoxin